MAQKLSFKKNSIKFFITFIFILISARASLLFSMDATRAVFVLILASRVYAKRIKLYTPFLLQFTVGFLALSLVQLYILNFDPDQIIGVVIFYFKHFIIAYLYVLYAGKDMLVLFERVLMVLIKISLVLFAVQLVAPDAIFKIGSLFGNRNPQYSNFFIFSFNYRHIVRNSGFAWEPGVYGCCLTIALMCNLINNKLKLNKNSYIILFTALTTTSTTAYMGCSIAMLALVFKNRNAIIMGLALLPILGYGFYSIPFIGDKINSQISGANGEIDELTSSDVTGFYNDAGIGLPFTRFASVLYQFNFLGNHIVTGLGDRFDYLMREDVPINFSCGLSDLITRFGIIGLVCYAIGLYKFFKKKITSNKAGPLIFTVSFLAFSFGEPIMILPMFFSFFIAGFVYKEEKLENKAAIPVLN